MRSLICEERGSHSSVKADRQLECGCVPTDCCAVALLRMRGLSLSVECNHAEWANERADVLARFTEELAKATGDGSKKRQAGEKPPWYEDDAHEGAIFSHLTKWKRGELVDPDSGAHPLVHLAWRALAIALRETGNVPRPDVDNVT